MEHLHYQVVLYRLEEALEFLGRTQFLKFFSNTTELELLVSVCKFENNLDIGICDCLKYMRTSPQTDASMHVFVRRMIELGAFVRVNSSKKSRKHIAISCALRAEIKEFSEIFRPSNNISTRKINN